MRLARDLLLIAVAALAPMAFTATSAFAIFPQPNVEVMEEGGLDHCPAVTASANHVVSGGCVVHANSVTNAQTFAHTGASEVATTTCANEFTAHVNEGGNGYIATNDASIGTNPASGCVITPCDEEVDPDPHPEYEWPVRIIEPTATSGERLIVTFCIRAFNTAEGSIGNNCTISVSVTETGHEQGFSATELPCLENPAVELSGTWATEADNGTGEDDVEIEHLIN